MADINQHKIVILETDLERRNLLRSFLSGNGYMPFCFEKVNICLDNLPVLNPDLFIIGNLMRDESLRIINALKCIDGNLPALLISNDVYVRDYVNHNGVYSFSNESEFFDTNALKEIIGTLLNEPSKKDSRAERPLIIGNHPEIVKIKKMIKDMAQSDEPILIVGEPGTGKELIAKAIVQSSTRQNHPFGKLDGECLKDQKPSPSNQPKGYLGIAQTIHKSNGTLKAGKPGTLFIKRVDLLPLSIQSELLLIIDNANDDLFHNNHVDGTRLRLITSTGPNLKKLVHQGLFREDLYYRINVMRMDVPSLKQREDDISLLADFFVDKFCRETKKCHFRLSTELKNMLLDYHWPGNVRQLESLIKRIVLNGQEDSVAAGIKSNTRNTVTKSRVATFFDVKNLSDLTDPKEIRKYLVDLNQLSLKKICTEFQKRTEKRIMKKALEKTNWNRKKAAMLLDISYKSMLNKIKAYKLA